MSTADVLAIIGIVVAVIAAAIAVYYGRRALNPPKRLILWHQDATPLLSLGHGQYRGVIDISVRGRPVENPYIGRLSIENAGRQDIDSSAFDQERHFAPSNAWQGIFSLLWSPIHAKLKFSEKTIIHSDIFVVAGAGRTFHESVMGLTWEGGFGVKLYVSRYVTLRFDVRDFLLPQEVLGRGRITNNITVLGGVSVWVPG